MLFGKRENGLPDIKVEVGPARACVGFVLLCGFLKAIGFSARGEYQQCVLLPPHQLLIGEFRQWARRRKRSILSPTCTV